MVHFNGEGNISTVFVGLLLLTQINCSYFNIGGSVGTALLDGVIALPFVLCLFKVV